jgi:hypothetical protein
MSERPTSRRILDQLGEDETLLTTDYTLADLKLLVPGFVLAFLVLGMMPAGWNVLGVVLGGAIMLGTVGVIWLSPPHRVAHTWLIDAVKFYVTDIRGETLMLAHDSDSKSDAARSLTRVDTVLRRWDAVQRTDDALVGAKRVRPANMALADPSDWEDAADALGEFLRSLGFDIQIYSTARPVDAQQIVAPYRDRLNDPDVQDNDRLRSVIKAYRDTLPEEFERRRTSVREYYILVAVTEREVHLDEQGVLAQLADAPVVGPVFGVIGSGRSDLDEGELLVRQHRELQSRLQKVRRGIAGLPGCQPGQVTAARLTDLLEEFWTGEPSHFDEEGVDSIRFHDVPFVRPDFERDPDTSDEQQSSTSDRGSAMPNPHQVATDGGSNRSTASGRHNS